MKLPIKKKYFDLIKEGKQKIEHRDAHITFFCEETGEVLRAEIIGVALNKRYGRFPDVCEDDYLVEFEVDMPSSNSRTIQSAKNKEYHCPHCHETVSPDKLENWKA